MVKGEFQENLQVIEITKYKELRKLARSEMCKGKYSCAD